MKDKKIAYYLFSKNYINQIIINISYNNTEDDVDYLSFYINFLKTIANKIDTDCFHLFFSRNYHRFPLLDEIIIFFNYDKDIMIKNTSRNIFLTLLKLNYKPFIEYICDLPSITLFLLFAENLKSQFKYFCTVKEIKQKNNSIQITNDNKIHINKLNDLEERKEMLADDITFIQDILSVDIPKINYLLTNTIIYISLSYLFNNILLRQNADISFFILTLFLEIIKSQEIKNIIVFILYSPKIQINIIEIVANDETFDNEKLLNLNKYAFKDNNIESDKNKLSFDDYIIFNYSSRFLNSLKHIKETDDSYIELIDISRQLNNVDNEENEIKIAIKLLNKKLKQINQVLKQMDKYHNFISRATGINVGVSINSSSHSFLQIFHDSNNYKYGLQDNIFKNECIYYLTDFHLSQYLCTVNEIILIYQIIKDKDISKSLKFVLNLLNDFSDGKDNNFASIFDNPDENLIQNFDTPPLPSFKFNSIINYSKFYESKTKVYQSFFGLEKNDKDNNINLTTFLSLPNVINNKKDILLYDDNINLIVNNKILSYKELDLNNGFFDKILSNFISNNETLILEKLIDLLLDSKKTLNKLIYKINTDIIIDLLCNGNNICLIKEEQKIKLNEQYKQLLQIINDLLDRSTLEEQIKEDKYFYEYFENCFIFNLKDISDIKKNYLKTFVLIINEEIIENNDNCVGLDLVKIPNEKYQMLKCLFQKFISLYDLKIILNDKNKQNLIMKSQQFPLNFFDTSKYNNEFHVDSLNQLKMEYYNLKFKTKKDSSFENGILSVYKNLLILFKYKIKIEKNVTDDGNTFVIDKIIPLRKIKIDEIIVKEFEKSKIILINILNKEDNFQLILLSDNDSDIIRIKELIINEIKYAIDMEYSSLKSYFKKKLEEETSNIILKDI